MVIYVLVGVLDVCLFCYDLLCMWLVNGFVYFDVDFALI